MTLESGYMETPEKDVNIFDVKVKQQDRAKVDKKDYTAPSLKTLGRLNTVTLGGSIGIGDSGDEYNTRATS